MGVGKHTEHGESGSAASVNVAEPQYERAANGRLTRGEQMSGPPAESGVAAGGGATVLHQALIHRCLQTGHDF